MVEVKTTVYAADVLCKVFQFLQITTSKLPNHQQEFHPLEFLELFSQPSNTYINLIASIPGALQEFLTIGIIIHLLCCGDVFFSMLQQLPTANSQNSR